MDMHVRPEPLLAPPSPGRRWTVIWSSDDPAYGGPGFSDLETDTGWHVPGESAYVLG
jgi:maltooligosyltrehalose trehalohydrolase